MDTELNSSYILRLILSWKEFGEINDTGPTSPVISLDKTSTRSVTSDVKATVRGCMVLYKRGGGYVTTSMSKFG